MRVLPGCFSCLFGAGLPGNGVKRQAVVEGLIYRNKR